MIAILLAEGFEEIEALTPLDFFRRAGLDAKTVSITEERLVRGAHGIQVTADAVANEFNANDVEALILPGGMPGAKNLDSSPFVDKAIRDIYAGGKRIGAICASPFLLGKRGLLKGERAVCYPGFEAHLEGATVEDLPCLTSGRITTARGAGAAAEFSIELLRRLADDATAERIASSVLMPKREESATAEAVQDDEPHLDPLLLTAANLALEAGSISTSLIQRKLNVGYGRAAKLLDILEDMGLIGECTGKTSRAVLMTAAEWERRLAGDATAERIASSVLMPKREESSTAETTQDDEPHLDPLLLTAANLAFEAGSISTSLIQRKLGVGYGRAAKLLDILEDMGLIGECTGKTSRDVLMTEAEWKRRLKSLD